MFTPGADCLGYVEEYLRAKLEGALAGQVAQSLVEDEISTGAGHDLWPANELARHMAGSWAVSEAIGPMTVLSDPDQAIADPAAARPPMRRSGCSPPP